MQTMRSELELAKIPVTGWTDDELDELLQYCEEDSTLRQQIIKEQNTRGLR